MTRKRAVVYARISHDRVGSGLGVERQEQDCRDLATRRGWEIVAAYRDNDVSAYSGKRRPGYERLLGDVQAGRADVVVAWHADRLHRSPTELERYIAVCDPLNVPTHTVRAGELDLSTANGRMTARITGAVARHESEQKGERMRRQKEQARAAGKWLGGRRPFGFAPDGVTVRPTPAQLTAMYRRAVELGRRATMPTTTELEELAARFTAEADAVADATRRVLAGESMRTIFTDWNSCGLTTSTGEPWNGSRLRQVLLRPRNAGLSGAARGERSNVPQVVGEAEWQPIVDRDSWEALRIKLTAPGRVTHAGNISRRLVGSFLYRCECGKKLTSGGNHSGGAGRYACPEQHLGRVAEPIDMLVFAAVEAVLARSGIDLMPEKPDVTPLRAKVEALRIRAEEIATLFADPDSGMTATQFKVSNERIQTQLRQLEAQIGTLTSDEALTGVADAADPVEAFRTAGMERQRAIIDALMEVTILRMRPGRQPDGSYFDPASVKIRWKAVTP